jgi:hypothetical protein
MSLAKRTRGLCEPVIERKKRDENASSLCDRPGEARRKAIAGIRGSQHATSTLRRDPISAARANRYREVLF